MKKLKHNPMSHADRRQRRERIAAEIRAGATPPQMARKYGLTLTFVEDICRAEGLAFDRKTYGKRGKR